MIARELCLLMMLAASLASAQAPPVPGKPPPSPEEISAAYSARVFKVMEGARYREGRQELPGDIAHLNLPPGYRYLGPDDARKVIVELWGNPPAAAGSSLLGLIIPDGEHLALPDSWAIVVSYNRLGHVSDSDEGRIDFEGLMTRLQSADSESNKARKASGFDTMDLAGWAIAPRYDRENHALFWARRFNVSRQREDTLNYDVRVLGRQGVVSLNAIAGMSRVTDIEDTSPALISMVRFNEGHRYGDFKPASDRKAGLTLSGMVLGGLPAADLPNIETDAPSGLWIRLIPVALILALLFWTNRVPTRLSASPPSPETLA